MAGDLSATISKTMLFSGLDPDDLRRLAGIARESTLSAGQNLFEQGDESDGLYIVVTGILRIYLTAEDTREATINLLEDGEVRACEVLDDSLGSLADVDWDLSALWNRAEAVELRRKIVETRCKCTWECAQGDNLLFRPRAWPGLALEALRS